MTTSKYDLDFGSLERIELPVTAPDGTKYILREASEDQAVKFKNAQMSRVLLGPQGKPQKIDGMGDLEPMLVAMLLVGENERPINENLVRGWPSRMVRKLFDAAKDISGLNETSPERKALELALSRSDSPVRLTQLRDFVLRLEGPVFEPLKKFLEPTEEEQAGNEQSDSTDGSA